ncbi:protein translocase subunit SecDF [Niallia circulans]|jgi:SecD/SecF fusion protein|uniref:Multifunctional fusion protein n=1 Tax=Niallia circulans TaxID=1397 RepID=A0A0J1I8U8_NIACI|nr:protein translocase subunit SecDF [Niallia circulans]KLV22352.1 preprotein translocase subunit SecD [Niallia circulans]MCM2980612.1 protein translocase subunit SecDF [Niallia circulans]MDR4317787.1 protein translocase subunit SecDF [Niallia circulans]MED3841571.1 protein translocase subunit SecDF [Niallia circulans]MED4243307.1 protein translocase subunit SecDF [Niallia circulans]
MVKRSRIVAFLLIIVLAAGLMGGTTNKILDNIKLGLDLQGGFEVLYKVEPLEKGKAKIDEAALKSTAQALDKRINVLGVSEPVIQIEGKDRIRVQLAGITDQNEAREMLSTEANLTFRDIQDKKLLDGSDLVQGGASQEFDQYGKPSVSLKLKDANKFKEITQSVLGSPLVIWLDFEEGDSYNAEAAKEEPKFLSAPMVSEVINSDTVSITGNFTVDEATRLAELLNAGALPVKLTEEYSTSVGAQFGDQALKDTVYAGIIGVGLVFLFMLLYYRLPGLVAIITLSIYVYLNLLVLDLMKGVLTLPGIAALILGVGMAVDANIITYERIKDELRVGKSLRAAFQAGNKNSIGTIFDANLTTIIASIVLFIYGTSSVKGFATLLIVSILVSFITAVYGSRLLLGLLVKSKLFDKKITWFGVNRKDIKHISENYDTLTLPTKFDRLDFVKYKNVFFTISSVLIVAGIVIMFIFKLNLGIDFASGSRIEVMADKALTTAEIEDHLDKLNVKADDIVISGDKQDTAAIRIKGDLSRAKINTIKSEFNKTYGHDPNVSSVSPTVGKELAKNAFKAIIFASIGIIIYVAIRFEVYMGLAAVLALLHDAFFIVVIFSLTRLEVDITFIAAVLTIVGYSINDTIVTFDRIRENLAKKKRIKTPQEIKDIINRSIRQTFARSINTVITVVICVVALLIFGSSAITNFSLALLIGLIGGAYSSIFIASQLWYVWKKRELKRKGVLITYKEKRPISDEPQV